MPRSASPTARACVCGADLHVISEDLSERLDVIPAQFRVIVTRRPRYGCRACETGVVQPRTRPRTAERCYTFR